MSCNSQQQLKSVPGAAASHQARPCGRSAPAADRMAYKASLDFGQVHAKQCTKTSTPKAGMCLRINHLAPAEFAPKLECPLESTTYNLGPKAGMSFRINNAIFAPKLECRLESTKRVSPKAEKSHFPKLECRLESTKLQTVLQQALGRSNRLRPRARPCAVAHGRWLKSTAHGSYDACAAGLWLTWRDR
jgi:hypothetical protein